MQLSRIIWESLEYGTDLPYGSLYFLDKSSFELFLCLSLRFRLFLAQKFNFHYSWYGFWGTFALIYVSVKSKLQHVPTGHTAGIWHLCRPGEEGIWLSESSRGWGIWSPCFRGGEFELYPRFHVKSLAWQAIMGDAVLHRTHSQGLFHLTIASLLERRDLITQLSHLFCLVIA